MARALAGAGAAEPVGELMGRVRETPVVSSGIVDGERFAVRYALSGEAAVLAVEREALGSDYRANGYTTIEQAIDLGERLRLAEGELLLDVGSGCGWPGLFLAARHGCAVVGVDPVADGVAAATERARADGLAERAWSVQAVADALPIRSGAVDAIVHTDVLC